MKSDRADFCTLRVIDFYKLKMAEETFRDAGRAGIRAPLLAGFDHRATAVDEAATVLFLTTVGCVAGPAAIAIALLVAAGPLVLVRGLGQTGAELYVIGSFAALLASLRLPQLIAAASLFDAGALGDAHAALIRYGRHVLIGGGLATGNEQQGKHCRDNSSDVDHGQLR